MLKGFKDLKSQEFVDRFSFTTGAGSIILFNETNTSQYLDYEPINQTFLFFNTFYKVKQTWGITAGIYGHDCLFNEKIYTEHIENTYPNYKIIDKEKFYMRVYNTVTGGVYGSYHFKRVTLLLSSQIGYQYRNINPFEFRIFLKENGKNNYLELYYDDIKFKNRFSLIECLETRIRLHYRFGISIRTEFLYFNPVFDGKYIKNDLQKGMVTQEMMNERFSMNSFCFGFGIYVRLDQEILD